MAMEGDATSVMPSVVVRALEQLGGSPSEAMPLVSSRHAVWAVPTSERGLVAKVYCRNPRLWNCEVEAYRLFAGAVPLPRLLQAVWQSELRFGYTITEAVDGHSQADVLARAAGEATQSFAAAGATLSALAARGKVLVAEPGFPTDPLLELGVGGTIFLEQYLPEVRLLRRYLARPTYARLERAIGRAAATLVGVDRCVIVVHGDYQPKNIITGPDAATIAGVIDWELARRAPALADVASMLRFTNCDASDQAFLTSCCDIAGLTDPITASRSWDILRISLGLARGNASAPDYSSWLAFLDASIAWLLDGDQVSLRRAAPAILR